MLWPALAALLSNLSSLLITVAVIVVVMIATLCWLGARRSGRPPQIAPGDALPGGDSDFAPAANDFAPAASDIGHPASDIAHPTAARPARALLSVAADLLVVDDSAVARAKLRRLFATSGYEVHQARDGVEALALLHKGRYRLMITDLEMPNLDGVALISTCQGQAHTAAMPILAITGHEDLQVRLNECHEICGIYRKPWIDEDLASHVALLLHKPEVRQVEAVEP